MSITTMNEFDRESMNVSKIIAILIFSLFPFFCFIQMTSLNSMHSFLINNQYTNLHLGFLSSAYVLGDALFLIPAGLVLDRWNAAKVAIVGLSVYLVAFYFFSNSQSITSLIFHRFFMGCAHAFALLSCFKLISQNIKPKHQSLMISLTLTIALIGGLVSQTPLLLLIEHMGLRNALHINVLIGIVIIGLMLISMRFITSAASKKESRFHLKSSIKYAALNYYNWYAAIFICVLSLPLMIFGSVWGIDFLTSIDKVDITEAANASSTLFIGVIIGCPIFGWLSEKISLTQLLRIGAIGTLIIFGAIIYFHHHNALFYKFAFFVLGIISAAQVLGYGVMARNTDPAFAGISIGFGNSLIMLFTSISQLIFGSLLRSSTFNSTCFLGNYTVPISFILALFVLSVIMSLRYRKGI